MLKVVILGTGRMGRQIAKRLSEEKDLKIVAAICAPNDPDLGKDIGLLSGTGPLGIAVESSENLSKILDKEKPEVVVDFTIADACFKNFKTVAEKRIDMIIGTTGLSEQQMNEIKKEIEKNKIGIVISPNMSIGVNVYLKLVEEATKMLKDYDIEIIEVHHRFKKDSPSGTAIKTASVIAKSLGKNLRDIAVYGREGTAPRKESEIGIHSIRAGDIIGEHTVLYSNIGERIEITHRAHSRDAFVNGVIKSIRFIHGKKGIYGIDDVMGIK